MNSKEFIVSQINDLAKNFPLVKFSYQLDEYSETHFIEVLPKDFFELYDNSFVNQQNKIVLAFIKEFPGEALAFITEDDLFKVDQPIYVKCGAAYKNSFENLSWNHENLNNLLTDFTPDIQNSFVFEQEIRQIKQNPVNCTFSFNENLEHTDFQSFTNNLPSESKNTDTVINDGITDESTYYLAA